MECVVLSGVRGGSAGDGRCRCWGRGLTYGQALDDRQDVLLADDEEILAVDLELGAGVLGVEDLVARP